jgi:hypothetical protein
MQGEKWTESRRGSWRFASMAAALILLASTTAWDAVDEIYSWTDENGVVHFSDVRPEGRSVDSLPVTEAYRPGSADYGTQDTVNPDEPTTSPGQQRREQMAESRAQRREQQSEIDYWCERHRTRLEQMEPARRVYYTNEAGEEIRMDDDQRVALIEESKAFLSEYCQ